jgi:hypothetical protein
VEAPLRELAGLGLAKHFWPGETIRGLVICVGDTAWDFAFALALDRMGIDARWVPSRALDDDDALVALDGLARWIWQRRRAPVTVCSTSSADDTGKLLSILTDLLPADIQLERLPPLELIPTRPGRLYERESAGAHQVTVNVHNGVTPALQTPLPKLVEAHTVHDLRWMTDVDVDAWKGLRHHRLAELVVDRLPITDGTVRSGRDGLAYVCPTMLTREHLTLEGQTVKPKLKPLSILEQLRGLLEIHGWSASPSDKGIYLRQASEIFGGPELLGEALLDERGRVLTVFLAKEGEKPPGWIIGERRYLTFDQLRDASRLSGGAEELILDLEDAGALVRGLALKCARCRNERFYRLTDVGEQFQCSRCWSWQPVNQETFQIGARHPEPTWLYGLAEVVFQFLRHNGDIPLLNSYRFMRTRAGLSTALQQRRVELVGELTVRDNGGETHELDIAITLDSELWLGEATADTNLGKNEARQKERLGELARTAKILNARGVILITADEWTKTTKKLARAAFPGVWPVLELQENARRANRWMSS